MESSQKVVTRFAPSPTGFLHIGGVRTALFAWAFARQQGGTFILRIEDTDKAREVEGSIQHIIDSLRWVGITWDEGIDIGGPHAPYLQSERLASYKKYAQQLVDKGLAYADPYTPEEVEVFRTKAQEEKRPFLFRDHRPEHPPVWDGTQPLRFKITDIKTTFWNDLVYGPLSAGPEALDDFILIKSDGYPTYNLSHMIDDLEMGVTHIMRADEFIASTPKFLALYDALGITPPLMATLPPIMAPDGKKKLGKRDGAKDILDYKAEGYLPEAMLNFLVFIGWNPGTEQEVMTAQEFIEAFDISRIHRSGGGFNVVKLDWFNREHMKKLSSDEFWKRAHAWIPEGTDTGMLQKIEHLIRDRIAKFADIKDLFDAREFEYFFKDPVIDPSLLIWKGLKIETPTISNGEIINEDASSEWMKITKLHLAKAKEILESVTDWTIDGIKSVLMPYAEEVGKGNVLWPLRVSLSGKDKSPDPFEIASIIGKDKTIERIDTVLK